MKYAWSWRIVKVLRVPGSYAKNIRTVLDVHRVHSLPVRRRYLLLELRTTKAHSSLRPAASLHQPAAALRY